MSPSLGALVSGEGGGVELTLLNTAKLLISRGHFLQVIAPNGSWLDSITGTEINGALQVPAQTLSRAVPITMPEDSVLGNMWNYVRQVRRQFDLCELPESALCWLGRISPEQGLDDVVAASQAMDIPLKVMGQVQNQSYFEQIQQDFPEAPFEYLGFLNTDQMQNIVRVGETGWLVEPDSVDGLVTAIQSLDQIDCSGCRQQAEREFSLEALGDRTEAWFDAVLKSWLRVG